MYRFGTAEVHKSEGLHSPYRLLQGGRIHRRQDWPAGPSDQRVPLLLTNDRGTKSEHLAGDGCRSIRSGLQDRQPVRTNVRPWRWPPRRILWGSIEGKSDQTVRAKRDR